MTHAIDNPEAPEGLKVFVAAEMAYGPLETADLRDGLIKLRNLALIHSNFDLAVCLSHTIALIHEIAKHIWGGAWQEALDK